MEDKYFLQASKVFWKRGQGTAMSTRGASGGLGTFWDTSEYDLLEEETCMHWIFTRVLHKESDQQVSHFNMYVPDLFYKKRDCWDSIKYFLSSHHPENIIVEGDLNITLSQAEKRMHAG